MSGSNRCAIYGSQGARSKTVFEARLSEARFTIDELIGRGINTFVTFAGDAYELAVASYIIDVKKKRSDVHLVVARPYPDFRYSRAMESDAGTVEAVMRDADMIKYIANSAGQYRQGDLERWMLSRCDTVLCITSNAKTQIMRLAGQDVRGKTVIRINGNDGKSEGAMDSNRKSAAVPAAADNHEQTKHSAEYSAEVSDARTVSNRRHRTGKADPSDRLQAASSQGMRFEASDRTYVEISETSAISKTGFAPGNEFQNKGARWTEEEERALAEQFRKGVPIEALARLHGRNAGGIRSRLKKLGLITDEESRAIRRAYSESNYKIYPAGGIDAGQHSNMEIQQNPAGGIDAGQHSNMGIQQNPAGGIDAGQIVIAASQVPGKAVFSNYAELREYLGRGLETYNNTFYSPDNIRQARADFAVLKAVRKKLTEKKKALKTAYMMPIQDVIDQLDELIGMIKEPYDVIDHMIKTNAREIKRRDIMEYAAERAEVLGEYADSVMRSPAFFNPRWCNASFKEQDWQKEVDRRISDARSAIEEILEAGDGKTGALLGFYFDKLSLEGADSFLRTMYDHEDPGMDYSSPGQGKIFSTLQGESVADIAESGALSGEIIEGNRESAEGDSRVGSLAAGSPAEFVEVRSEATGNERIAGGAYGEAAVNDRIAGGAYGEAAVNDRNAGEAMNRVTRTVRLTGSKEDIERYLDAAKGFGIAVE